MPGVVGAPDGVHQGLLARGVAVGAGQAAPLGPTSVAVHHDRDVTRDARRGRGRRAPPRARYRLARPGPHGRPQWSVHERLPYRRPANGAPEVGDVADPRPTRRSSTASRPAARTAAARTARASSEMVAAIAEAIGGAPPRGAGRHRHRQVARLPRPRGDVASRRPSSPPRPRRCRTSSPTRSCRSLAAHLGRESEWAVLKGRSNYLCLQRLDEARRPPAQPQLGLEGLATVPERELSVHRGVGRRRPTPATGPSCSTNRVRGPGRRSASAHAECPGAIEVPEGRRLLRRTGPAEARDGRRGHRQHPPLRTPPRDPAAPSCPTTTSSSSTRPTRSRTSSRHHRHRAGPPAGSRTRPGSVGVAHRRRRSLDGLDGPTASRLAHARAGLDGPGCAEACRGRRRTLVTAGTRAGRRRSRRPGASTTGLGRRRRPARRGSPHAVDRARPRLDAFMTPAADA